MACLASYNAPAPAQGRPGWSGGLGPAPPGAGGARCQTLAPALRWPRQAWRSLSYALAFPSMQHPTSDVHLIIESDADASRLLNHTVCPTTSYQRQGGASRGMVVWGVPGRAACRQLASSDDGSVSGVPDGRAHVAGEEE